MVLFDETSGSIFVHTSLPASSVDVRCVLPDVPHAGVYSACRSNFTTYIVTKFETRCLRCGYIKKDNVDGDHCKQCFHDELLTVALADAVRIGWYNQCCKCGFVQYQKRPTQEACQSSRTDDTQTTVRDLSKKNK